MYKITLFLCSEWFREKQDTFFRVGSIKYLTTITKIITSKCLGTFFFCIKKEILLCQGVYYWTNSIEFKTFMERVNQYLCFSFLFFMETSIPVLLVGFHFVRFIFCLIKWIFPSSMVTDNTEREIFWVKVWEHLPHINSI